MPANPLKIVVLSLAVASPIAWAQMDVDQADSLNFEAFHKDKKESIKVWKDDKTKKDETVKTYEQTAPASATPAPAGSLSSTPVTPAAATPPATTTAVNAAPAPVAKADVKAGQRFELRERYSLGRSTRTPYSAFYVIEALHQQAAKYCPRGWRKLNERVEPVEQDFYQYFEIECL